MVRLGQGAFIGFGDMSTGYAVNGAAADIQLRFVVDDAFDNPQLERDVIEFNDLTSQYQNTAVLKAGQRRVTGNVSLRVTYDGLQDILRMITGHDVTPAGSPNNSYAFVPVDNISGSHYWLGSPQRNLVMEVYRGGGVANSVFYQGIEISQAVFRFDANSYVMLELTFVGRGYTITAASTTPAFKSSFAVTPVGQAGAFLSLGGTAVTTRSATVTINLNLEPRYDVSGIDPLLPLPGGKTTIQLACEIERDDDTDLNILDDPENARFASVGSPATAAGTLELQSAANNQLNWTFDELILQAPAENRAAGLGQTLSSLTMDVYASSLTATPYTVTLISDENAYNLT